MGDTETIDNLLDSAFEKLKQAESIPDKKTKASEHTNIGRTIEGDLGPKDDIESALTGILAGGQDLQSFFPEEISGEEIDGFIEQIISELTSKDMLAEPFADLALAYPKWLAAQKNSIPYEQFEKYSAQCELVCEIDRAFKDPKTVQDCENQQQYIFGLLQKMHEFGDPPADLLRQLGLQSPNSQSNPSECAQM